MIVDQDVHLPHHLPTQSRHGSGTAWHDRQALVPPWTPLAHAFAHSRSDGDQAQPEGLETIPSRLAQGWHLPREARGRLERSVEACTGQVSRLAVCHMPVSQLAATLWDRTSEGGIECWKVGEELGFSVGIPKNRCFQPSYCTVGGRGQTYHNKNPPLYAALAPHSRCLPPWPPGPRLGVCACAAIQMVL